MSRATHLATESVSPRRRLDWEPWFLNRERRTLLQADKSLPRSSTSQSNTGDKLRASNMLNARQLHPLVRRHRHCRTSLALVLVMRFQPRPS